MMESLLNKKVWYTNGGEKLIEGTVIHELKRGNQLLYVIETPTPIEPVYEVRQWYNISLNKDGPLHWRARPKNI